jgi:hypothetical protein
MVNTLFYAQQNNKSKHFLNYHILKLMWHGVTNEREVSTYHEYKKIS